MFNLVLDLIMAGDFGLNGFVISSPGFKPRATDKPT